MLTELDRIAMHLAVRNSNLDFALTHRTRGLSYQNRVVRDMTFDVAALAKRGPRRAAITEHDAYPS